MKTLVFLTLEGTDCLSILLPMVMPVPILLDGSPILIIGTIALNCGSVRANGIRLTTTLSAGNGRSPAKYHIDGDVYVLTGEVFTVQSVSATSQASLF